MLYCGFDLAMTGFKALLLSSGFALLDSKFFYFQSGFCSPPLFTWIDSFRLHQNVVIERSRNEPCLYFFDDWQFYSFSYTHELVLPINEPDKIYLLPHRHLLDISQFIKAWKAADYTYNGNDLEYILASSMRIFDIIMAKQINNCIPLTPDSSS